MQAVAMRHRQQGSAARRPVVVAALCSVLLLTSCATRLAYNYLDWIVPWYVNGYVELNADQKSYFKRQLRVVLAWHREQELPRYIEDLRALQSQISQPTLSQQQILAFMHRAELAWKRLIQKGMPYLGTLLRTFDDRQTTQLLDALQQSEQKRRAKLAQRPVAEQQRRDVKAMRSELKDWVGSVGASQERLITRWAASKPPNMTQWLAYRAYWGEGLVTTLDERRGRSFVPLFQSLVLEQEPYASHPYRRYQLPRSLEYVAEFLSEFHASLSETQKAYLLQRLQRVINDLEYLHKNP